MNFGPVNWSGGGDQLLVAAIFLAGVLIMGVASHRALRDVFFLLFVARDEAILGSWKRVIVALLKATHHSLVALLAAGGVVAGCMYLGGLGIEIIKNDLALFWAAATMVAAAIAVHAWLSV
jgi:hypothetical protein